jgi:hypothetical protein
MLGWLMDKWSFHQEQRDLQDFVEKLRVMDGSEIGFVMAIALDWRNEFLKDGNDMLQPFVVLVQSPHMRWIIVRTIKQLQQNGGVVGASGLMVWLHTLRAASRLENRRLGRDLWRELERGFSHIEEGAESAWRTYRKALDIKGGCVFPDGLAPTPEA